MPTPPPGAYNKTGTTAADLMFPDAKWSDTPPNYSLEGSLGALPAVPPPGAHDSFPTPPAGGDFGAPLLVFCMHCCYVACVYICRSAVPGACMYRPFLALLLLFKGFFTGFPGSVRCCT